MGMFDYMHLRCPSCGHDNEEQSKAGPCILRHFTLDRVPASILEDMAGDTFHCEECHTAYTVRAEIVARGYTELIDPPSTEERT